MREKLIIGGLENLSLPDWGIPKIRARVDTGARTSAIHVEHVRVLPKRRVRFDVVIGWRGKRRRTHVVAKIKTMTTVRPTTGKLIHRYVVSTTMVLGPVRRKVDLTLADRKRMTFRMLLGRTALQRDFLVDPARIGVLSQNWS